MKAIHLKTGQRISYGGFAPHTNTFPRPRGAPEIACNIDGEKLLPINADASGRVDKVLRGPSTLKPLPVEVLSITKGPRGIGK